MLVVAAVLVYLSRTYVWAAEFPGDGEHRLVRRRARRRGDHWVQDSLRRLHERLQGRSHQRPAQPAGGPADRLAVVARRPRSSSRSPRCSASWRAAVTAAVCSGCWSRSGLWQDSMIDAGLDARRHRPGRCCRAWPLGVWMGRSRPRRPLLRPVLDAGADDAAVRVPGAVPRPVRHQPVHRDRGRGRLRRPGRHQDRRGRHQGGARATVEAATSAGSSTWQVIRRCSCRWPAGR